MQCHTSNMKNRSAARVLLALASAGLVLSGCSLFGNGPSWGNKKDADKVDAVPALPEPVPTHEFTIDATTDIVGVVQKTLATKEDTLTDIARRFNVGYEEIMRANPGVDPWLPGENREIVIPSQFILPNAPREGIVINAAAMRLFYYPKVKKGEPQVVHTYPIGIGKVGWKTPEGATKIVRRQADPTWRPTPSIIKEHLEERGEKLDKVIGPGPDNPLGRFAFYLGWPSYMIHGTNKPAGVGLRSSHGCIRLYPEDIEALFSRVARGTAVRIVNQPVLAGWRDGQLYLEVHPPLAEEEHDLVAEAEAALGRAIERAGAAVSGAALDHAAIEKIVAEQRGIPFPVLGSNRSPERYLAGVRIIENNVPIAVAEETARLVEPAVNASR